MKTKHLLYFIVFIFLFSCKKEERYIPTVKVSVIETGLDEQFTAMSFASPNLGIITTSKGKVLKSTNQGATWDVTILDATETESFQTLATPTNQSIYITGENLGFIRSLDGGNTYSTGIPFYNFKSMSFINDSVGFGAKSSSLYKTTDRGSTFTLVSASSLNSLFGDATIKFLNDTLGFANDFDYVYRTTDGGLTFDEKTYFLAVSTMKFVSSTTGYALGSISGNTGLFKTTNAGETWQHIYSGSNSDGEDYSIFDFDINGDVICGVGYYSIMISKDGGNNFTNHFNQNGETVFVDFKKVRHVGNNKFIATGTKLGSTGTQEIKGNIYTIQIP
jgi:photosystem II stability/assembly factor-like uncharacterized protein